MLYEKDTRGKDSGTQNTQNGSMSTLWIPTTIQEENLLLAHCEISSS
jgi:hypothetical protein